MKHKVPGNFRSAGNGFARTPYPLPKVGKNLRSPEMLQVMLRAGVAALRSWHLRSALAPRRDEERQIMASWIEWGSCWASCSLIRNASHIGERGMHFNVDALFRPLPPRDTGERAGNEALGPVRGPDVRFFPRIAGGGSDSGTLGDRPPPKRRRSRYAFTCVAPTAGTERNRAAGSSPRPPGRSVNAACHSSARHSSTRPSSAQETEIG